MSQSNYTQILAELAEAESIGYMKNMHEVLVKIVPSIWMWDEHISKELEKVDIYEKEHFFGPIERLCGKHWYKKIRWYIKYCTPEIYPNRKVYSRFNHAIGYIEDKKFVAQCPMKFIYANLGL